VELRYSREHAWVARSGGRMRVGISAYAQEELGEVAFIELPEPGKSVRAGEAVCVIDSLKSTSEIYAPVSGRIAAVNTALRDEKGAGLVNRDPLGAGWLFEIEGSDPAELDALMSGRQYQEYVAGGASGSPLTAQRLRSCSGRRRSARGYRLRAAPGARWSRTGARARGSSSAGGTRG
jgi:glycine cleavage system H protein